MKDLYSTPRAEVVSFHANSIILASNGDDTLPYETKENELPRVPIN